MWISPTSLAAACLSRSCWSTDRCSWAPVVGQESRRLFPVKLINEKNYLRQDKHAQTVKAQNRGSHMHVLWRMLPLVGAGHSLPPPTFPTGTEAQTHNCPLWVYFVTDLCLCVCSCVHVWGVASGFKHSPVDLVAVSGSRHSHYMLCVFIWSTWLQFQFPCHVLFCPVLTVLMWAHGFVLLCFVWPYARNILAPLCLLPCC